MHDDACIFISIRAPALALRLHSLAGWEQKAARRGCGERKEAGAVQCPAPPVPVVTVGALLPDGAAVGAAPVATPAALLSRVDPGTCAAAHSMLAVHSGAVPGCCALAGRQESPFDSRCADCCALAERESLFDSRCAEPAGTAWGAAAGACWKSGALLHSPPALLKGTATRAGGGVLCCCRARPCPAAPCVLCSETCQGATAEVAYWQEGLGIQGCVGEGEAWVPT